MKTVKQLLLELAHQIDPRTEAQVEFTEATIGVEGGDKLTTVKLLRVYNTGRTVLVQAMSSGLTPSEAAAELPGMVESEAFSWGARAEGGLQAERPEGCVLAISAYSTTGSPGKVLLLPVNFKARLILGTDRHFLESAERVYILEEGRYFTNYGSVIQAGDVKFRLEFIKCLDWEPSDLDENETVDERHYPVLLDLAQAASRELGTVELNALARRLLGKGETKG